MRRPESRRATASSRPRSRTWTDKSDEPREVLQVDARRRGTVVVARASTCAGSTSAVRPQNPDGGRMQKEHPIDSSNVMLFSEQGWARACAPRRSETSTASASASARCGTKFD